MSVAQCNVVLPVWKPFLKSSDEPPNLSLPKRSTDINQVTLCGEEVQEAYKDIVGSEAFESKIACQTPPKTRSSLGVRRKNDVPSLNTVMKMIECNNIHGLTDAVMHSEDLIHTLDLYGWSLLMCAACAGSEDIVKLLLDVGADPHVRDKSGNSCLSLARKNGHVNVVNILVTWGKNTPVRHGTHMNEGSRDVMPPKPCESCHVSVHPTEVQKHQTSMIHLLNKQPKPCRTYYCIPESNRGYQLLLKRGWNQDRGLGPHGDGRKWPLKTVLKKDRKGLGASKQVARVTHYSSYDLKAVSGRAEMNGKQKPVTKQQRGLSIQKEKWRERYLRRELS